MTRIASILLTLSLILPMDVSSAVSSNQADIPGISIKNDIISWYPQVIEYLYVNGTKVETVKYLITFEEKMNEGHWTVDGYSVDGSNDNNKNYYIHTWDVASKGLHTVTYEGITAGQKTEFKWYVNVYEIGGDSDGSIFDVISDMLENHGVELKIRWFRYRMSNEKDPVEFAKQNAGQLHDEISGRQMKREALDLDFRNGNIIFEEYVTARKKVQTETRYYMKLAQEMARIIRNEFNNEELGKEFENFSFTEDDWAWNEQVKEKLRERQSSTYKSNKNDSSGQERD